MRLRGSFGECGSGVPSSRVSRALAGNDLDDRIPAAAVDEAVDIDAGFPFHPEHRVQSPDRMRVQHLIGIVAPRS